MDDKHAAAHARQDAKANESAKRKATAHVKSLRVKDPSKASPWNPSAAPDDGDAVPVVVTRPRVAPHPVGSGVSVRELPEAALSTIIATCRHYEAKASDHYSSATLAGRYLVQLSTEVQAQIAALGSGSVDKTKRLRQLESLLKQWTDTFGDPHERGSKTPRQVRDELRAQTAAVKRLTKLLEQRGDANKAALDRAHTALSEQTRITKKSYAQELARLRDNHGGELARLKTQHKDELAAARRATEVADQRAERAERELARCRDSLAGGGGASGSGGDAGAGAAAPAGRGSPPGSGGRRSPGTVSPASGGGSATGGAAAGGYSEDARDAVEASARAVEVTEKALQASQEVNAHAMSRLGAADAEISMLRAQLAETASQATSMVSQMQEYANAERQLLEAQACGAMDTLVGHVKEGMSFQRMAWLEQQRAFLTSRVAELENMVDALQCELAGAPPPARPRAPETVPVAALRMAPVLAGPGPAPVPASAGHTRRPKSYLKREAAPEEPAPRGKGKAPTGGAAARKSGGASALPEQQELAWPGYVGSETRIHAGGLGQGVPSNGRAGFPITSNGKAVHKHAPHYPNATAVFMPPGSAASAAKATPADDLFAGVTEAGAASHPGHAFLGSGVHISAAAKARGDAVAKAKAAADEVARLEEERKRPRAPKPLNWPTPQERRAATRDLVEAEEARQAERAARAEASRQRQKAAQARIARRKAEEAVVEKEKEKERGASEGGAGAAGADGDAGGHGAASAGSDVEAVTAVAGGDAEVGADKEQAESGSAEGGAGESKGSDGAGDDKVGCDSCGCDSCTGKCECCNGTCGCDCACCCTCEPGPAGAAAAANAAGDAGEAAPLDDTVAQRASEASILAAARPRSAKPAARSTWPWPREGDTTGSGTIEAPGVAKNPVSFGNRMGESFGSKWRQHLRRYDVDDGEGEES